MFGLEIVHVQEEINEGVVRTRLLPVFKYVKGQNIPAEGKLAIYIQEHNSNERKASEPFLV